MVRVHILALPRSGTTALSKALSQQLNLPLIREPIYIWSDGFRLDLNCEHKVTERNLIRIQKGINKISKLKRYKNGYVEKTPSSAFLSTYMDQILSNSKIIVIERSKNDIARSMQKMIFEDHDGNLNPDTNFHLHKIKRRVAKTFMLLKIFGVLFGIITMFRSYRWLKINSIFNFKNEARIQKYVDDASINLSNLIIGDTNQVMKVSYEDFKANPDEVLDQITKFCINTDN